LDHGVNFAYNVTDSIIIATANNNSNGFGIQVRAESAERKCSNIKIIGVVKNNGDSGVQVKEAEDVVVDVISDGNAYDGIKVDGAVRAVISGTFKNNGRYGINGYAGTGYSGLIDSVIFYNNSNGNINDPDNAFTIRDNVGFVTENSGIASGLADGSYIAHGLVGTPTTVTLTCLNSTYDGVPVIVSWNKASTNSTHIAINIYWANGTAITDPVIAVSWHAKYQP